MATKVVTLAIKLKDGVSSTAKGIGKSMKAMGVSFQAVAKVGIAGFAALTAGIVALGKAFAEQESVNSRLRASFNAAGEDGDKALAKWSEWATQIQRVTTLGDEEIMNLVSLGKNMGIANDKMAGATRGAIGLSKAFGIDMTSSMKMVALAIEGDYNMLQRYIPALKGANSEAEKAAIVNEAMANGFKLAEAELETLSGQWKSLKGVIGDAMQEAGGAVGEGGFADSLKQVKESIINLSESGALKDLADAGSGLFDKWAMGASQFIADLGRITGGFKTAQDVIKESKNPFTFIGRFKQKGAERREAEEQRRVQVALARRQEERQVLITPGSSPKKTATSGLTDVAEKMEPVKAVDKVAQQTVAPIASSVSEMFEKLSKGRSFEGTISALSQVSTAAQGEGGTKVISLLEQQNKILEERLGGIEG